MDEPVFWRNYYQRIQFLRAKVGIDGLEMQKLLGAENEEDIIFAFQPEDLTAPPRRIGSDASVSDDRKASSSPHATDENDTVKSEPSAGDNPADEALDEERKREKQRRQDEAALAAEVAAELEAVDEDGVGDAEIDLGDLDDLDDLGDLDHLEALSSDESGEAGEIDAALEAQIAAELDLGEDDS